MKYEKYNVGRNKHKYIIYVTHEIGDDEIGVLVYEEAKARNYREVMEWHYRYGDDYKRLLKEMKNK